jgi:chromosomal replication initiator protein
MEHQHIWQATLGELELALSRANFTTWFKNTFIASFEGDVIIIAVPNTFTKAWLEKKYHSAILKALQKITDNQVRTVTYKVESRQQPGLSRAVEPMLAPTTVDEAFTLAPENPNTPNEFGLNPKYAFGSFVIGKGNELAHAASTAVAKKPGSVYNPLFIYGGVGLGKTHLLQAVGNHILQENPTKKVRYVSCEKFTNDFIKAVSTNRMDRFKETYRSVDVLLIDDIQFLAGKEGTQEAFFHTFNDLHQANKQIILSSDRPPKAIATLEQRLISRFEWGMIADISLPDLETRSAILRLKLEEKNEVLTDDVVTFLATSVQNNIRELEGALNKLIAYRQLNNTELTLESTKKLLGTLSPKPQNRGLTPKHIISLVAEFYGVAIEDILGSCRKKTLVNPRQIIMYLLREDLGNSYPTIGQEIGNRDHTTVMHACLKINQALEQNERIIQDIKFIRERMYNTATK